MSQPGSSGLTPFHLAFPVRDVEEARQFYGGLLQCAEGRSDDCAYRNELTAPTPGTALIFPLRLALAPTSPFHTAIEGGMSK